MRIRATEPMEPSHFSQIVRLWMISCSRSWWWRGNSCSTKRYMSKFVRQWSVLHLPARRNWLRCCCWEAYATLNPALIFAGTFMGNGTIRVRGFGGGGIDEISPFACFVLELFTGVGCNNCWWYKFVGLEPCWTAEWRRGGRGAAEGALWRMDDVNW